MPNYNLTIKRRYQTGGINPPISIATQAGDFVIENGKEITITLPAGDNRIVFLCTTNLNDKPVTRTKTAEIHLCADCNMEICCFNGIISIDKMPISTPCANTQSYTTTVKTSNTKKANNSNSSSNSETNAAKSFFTRIWNNNVIMIILSAILIIPFLFIFSGELLMFIIISEVIANGYIIAIFKNEKNTLGKAIFIATVSAFVFGLILGLICGIELYPDSGCSHCNYKGYFGGNGGKIIDCPKC